MCELTPGTAKESAQEGSPLKLNSSETHQGSGVVPKLDRPKERISQSMVWMRDKAEGRKSIGVVTDMGICTVHGGSFTTAEIQSPDGNLHIDVRFL